MKRKSITGLLIMLLIGMTFSTVGTFAADEGAWVLVETIHEDSLEKIVAYNKNYDGIYELSGRYQPGDFLMTQTYVGEDSPSKGLQHGEHASYQATYSAPPEVLVPGEELHVALHFEPLSVDMNYYNFGMSTRALFGGSNLANRDGDYTFKLDKKVGLEPIEEDLYLEIPSSWEGEERKLQLQLNSGYVSMKTWYVYRYQTAPVVPEQPEPVQASGEITLRLGQPHMMVNGMTREVDPGRGTAPQQIGGRTMIPIAAVVEAMGGEIGWDGTEKKITIEARGNHVSMWLDRKEIQANGTQLMMDVAPVALNGRTFVPVRFAAENLGAQVGWDGATNTVTIRYGE